MFKVVLSETFSAWLSDLKDARASAAVSRRLTRAAAGHFGDCKAVGDGVREMRIHVGPGYRLYFVQRGDVLLVFLAGGNKHTQQKDIARALVLAKEV